jgi:hypothetical protein
VDAGGLEREWFGLVCQEIFDPKNGLFIKCSDFGGYNINPLSERRRPNHLSFFRFVGRIFGKALMQSQALNANLCLPLRKQMVGMPITFSDLEFVDEELYRNLRWLKSNIEDVSSLLLDFTVTYNSLDGEAVTYDLLPNGSDVMVNQDNKFEYLHLKFKHRLLDSIKPQLESLLVGIYEIIPPEFLSVFDYQEFDLLLCGVPEIELTDWMKNTEYLGEYTRLGERHPVIRWFWLSVEEMSQEERVRLLHFVTGCGR